MGETLIFDVIYYISVGFPPLIKLPLPIKNGLDHLTTKSNKTIPNRSDNMSFNQKETWFRQKIFFIWLVVLAQSIMTLSHPIKHIDSETKTIK